MSNWLDRFFAQLVTHWPVGAADCQIAWALSQYESLARQIDARCLALARSASLPYLLRLRPFVRGEDLLRRLAPSMFSEMMDGELTERGIAAGRVLAAANPIWPIRHLSLVLLNLWPGWRRRCGLYLQVAALCGATRGELVQMAGSLLQGGHRRHRELDPGLMVLIMSQREAPWTQRLDATRLLRFLRNLAREMMDAGARNPLSRAAMIEWFSNDRLIQHSLEIWTQITTANRPPELDATERFSVPRSFVDVEKIWLHYWAHNRLQDTFSEVAQRLYGPILGITPAPSWAVDYMGLTSSSLGWGCTRSLLAELEPAPGLMGVFTKACQLSLAPDTDPRGFVRAQMELTGMPGTRCWLALARHIARMSSTEDRQLLVDSVRHPDTVDGLLSIGLRYLVRGDVMLLDESVVTLDELADESGQPRLPYLEDLPDETIIHWERSFGWAEDGSSRPMTGTWPETVAMPPAPVANVQSGDQLLERGADHLVIRPCESLTLAGQIGGFPGPDRSWQRRPYHWRPVNLDRLREEGWRPVALDTALTMPDSAGAPPLDR